jgi:hypothetical protein
MVAVAARGPEKPMIIAINRMGESRQAIKKRLVARVNLPQVALPVLAPRQRQVSCSRRQCLISAWSRHHRRHGRVGPLGSGVKVQQPIKRRLKLSNWWLLSSAQHAGLEPGWLHQAAPLPQFRRQTKKTKSPRLI